MSGEEDPGGISLAAEATTISVPPESNPWFVEMVKRARTGDRSAFDALYKGFYTPIHNYLAHMIGDDEEGCDLAQETFLKAWQGLANVHSEIRFGAWLYRIATNTAIDHLRRRKLSWRQSKHGGEVGMDIRHEHIWITGPEDRVAEMEHIQQALAQVSLKYRSCMLLQIVAALSQREIAASLNISEKSVSIYVSRGCEQFRLAYQRLLQSNDKSSLNEGGPIREKLDSYALFKLGTETIS